MISAVFLFLSGLAAAQESARIALEQDADYFGFDLSTERNLSLDQCKARCLGNPACRAFTYNTSARFCFLKTDFGELRPFKGAVAGRVTGRGAAEDLGVPPRLGFVPEATRTLANQFRERIKANTSLPVHMGFGTLVNTARQHLASGQVPSALSHFSSALRADPAHSGTWQELSDAARLNRLKDTSKTRAYNRIAIASALNAYFASRTTRDRAAALARVAKSFAAQFKYRAALTAYKESLRLREDAAERAAFADLLKKHGFRMRNHTVDSDSRTPRACVQFSEQLLKDSGQYTNFVRLDGAEPQSLQVSGSQLCVEGLAHGRNYRIVFRAGLPSAIDEVLAADTTLDFYIRDRKPAARFTGSNFVLPATARRGIPLVTINADKADLKLYRVGERALAPLLRGSQFLQQISSYEIDSIKSDLGAPEWEGAIDIRSNLNKEVVTSVPIDQILKSRKPGVYLLTATPPSTSPYPDGNPATQWFVISDIGLTTFSGSARLTVFARSLATAKPLANAEITLLARNNEVLGTATTDAEGKAQLDAGLIRGRDGLAPAVITARLGTDDFSFLDISKAGFDFSDRGVAGREAPAGVDVYAWTERGIYRAGETVHVAALARDASANAVSKLPLTFIFKRPDGVEDRRVVDDGAELGGYAVKLDVPANAKRGTWQVQVHTDPKQDPVATQRFLVEDFQPERTDMTLTPAAKSIAPAGTLPVKVEGRYLYGAPAGGLKLEGEVLVKTVRERDGHKGYLFGLAKEGGTGSQFIGLEDLAPLNESGEGTVNVELSSLTATTRPRTADVVLRLKEGSGRAIERRSTVAVDAEGPMIGIRPGFEGGQAAEGSNAEFQVIALAPDGSRTALPGSSWSLVKIERNYQYYRIGSYWQFESVDLEKQVADGTVDLGTGEPAKLSLPVEWGRYRLQVESPGGPVTSVLFNAGWFVTSKSTETPDGLEIALDKDSYKAGETARLKVSPRFAGELLLAIGGETLHETRTVSVPAEGTTIDIPVKADWGAGAYVLATLYRPGDARKSRMPQRSIGVKWLSVSPGLRKLQVNIQVSAQTQPHQPLIIPLNVTGVAEGTEAYVAVAAVDVGILNLTNYKSPDPAARYFGQRKLALGMHDLYGKLIDSSLGQTGRIRSGGDGFDGMSASGNPPTEKLVSFFSGPVRVSADGSAEVSFDIPQFNGTARIMAVAWTKDGVGAAETETTIRAPVVVTASLPKFMAPGDEGRLLLEIAAPDAPAGSYDVKLESSGNLVADEAGFSGKVQLNGGQPTRLAVPVMATSTGSAWARVIVSGADGLSVVHETTMSVRPGALPVTRKLQVSLAANGGSLVVDRNLLSASELDGAKIAVSVARPSAFDVPSLLLQLDRYPYGCTEQITSKALPLLYAGEFAEGFTGLDVEGVEKRVQGAINSVLSNQSSGGGFSLWGSAGDNLWLSAYVTDFLTRASEKGYDVPSEPMRQALNSLRNTLAYYNNLERNDAAIAYALYVLARNRMASAGDLRYYAESQIDAFRSPIARAQLASAMALYGDQQRAEKTFRSAFTLARSGAVRQSQLYTYGSPLRDASAMLVLAGESRPRPDGMSGMTDLVRKLVENDKYTSTQEQAWMLLAARTEMEANRSISLDVNGTPHSGAYARRIEGGDLKEKPLRIANRSGEPVQATVTTVAVPAQDLPPGGDGFAVVREYYRMNGTKTSVGEVRQNDRFVVVITAQQTADLPSRVVITDLLPAGFEIDNPSIVRSADLNAFKWLPQSTPAHLEFRDDRFVAAFDRAKGGNSRFVVAYIVRAVTPGTFRHPAAQIEDMYRPELSARTASGWMKVDGS
ncbi:MAG: alpha-2-macroglobulin family protein [Pseudomonadota bacterium]